MNKSQSESTFELFEIIKKFENKKKSVEYFKSSDVRKTTQIRGWQIVKHCRKCESDMPHSMNTVTR
jgi:hypothetical protein